MAEDIRKRFQEVKKPHNRKPRGNYRDPVQGFFGNIEYNTDGCWLWMGALDKDGYGYYAAYRKRERVHRYSYELLREDIPDGLVIDHLCRVRSCANPEHLEAVTDVENIMRGNAPAVLNSQKTHCVHGHELIGINLYIQKKTGKRFCRTCDRRRGLAYEKRKREAKNY